MIRFIIPILLVGTAIAGFFTLVSPKYEDIKFLRAQVVSFDNALDNAKALENERDKLVTKKNSIDKTNISKIQKMLPDNVDNIRLILEIENLATPYGMVLKDVRYEDVKEEEEENVVQAGTSLEGMNKDYGIWNLEFSTEGTYSNFISFTKDLEKNLRMVDISSVQFSSSVSEKAKTASDYYKYTFKIKTYWLKN